MIRALYDWTLRLADSPRALVALFLVAFIEASFFPIPVEVLMIPMILAAPSRAWVVGLVALSGSVIGGLGGYAIGALAFDSLGAPILEALGKTDSMEAYNARFNGVGFWAVMIGGLSPFPYKVITIMSGWTGMPLATFIGASILARGIRYMVIAALLWKFGAPIRDFIERRLGLVFALFLVVLIGGFYAVRFL